MKTFYFGLTVAALAACIPGCNPAAPPAPPPPAKLSPASGIDFFGGSCAHYVLQNGKPVVVVWVDFAEIAVSGGGWQGYWALAADGRRLDWNVDRRDFDGKQGTVVINGQNHDVAEGNVFLVSTKESPAKVTQLKRDLRADGHVLTTALAEKDPEISKFIATASKGK